MIDFAAIRAALKVRSLAQSDIGDVNLAGRFVEDVERATGIAPVSTRNAIHIYDQEDGVWREIKKDEAQSLIQGYDGVDVGYVRKKKDGSEEDYTSPLRLSAGKVEGIYKCLLASQDALDPQFFDLAPRGVAFKNGFVTVTKDGVTSGPKSPDNRVTTCQPFDYSPEADFPEWRAVLGKVFEGDNDAPDKRLLLQEFAGACIIGIATDYAACLVMLGDGANGKSVVAETIADYLLPPDSVTYTTPQSWARSFTLSRLRNSRLNVATELPDAELTSSDVFKAVIDGGKLEVEDKNKDPYTMRPRAGHIFLANGLPHTPDNSHGFWRRFRALEFNRDFTKDPKQETKEAIKAKLTKEAAGIMIWALAGAVRLLRNGKYTVPASHYRIMGEWRKQNDQVASFVDECCTTRGETSGKEAFNAFRDYCDRNGRKTMSNLTFGRRLKGVGISSRSTRNGVVYGIEILPTADWAAGKVMDVMVGDGWFSEPSHAQHSVNASDSVVA
jgi:putative DNA primase/helicase